MHLSYEQDRCSTQLGELKLDLHLEIYSLQVTLQMQHSHSKIQFILWIIHMCVMKYKFVSYKWKIDNV